MVVADAEVGADIREVKGRLHRFEVAFELGKVAAGLRQNADGLRSQTEGLDKDEAAEAIGKDVDALLRQANHIEDHIDMLGLDRLFAPEGWGIQLWCTGNEDPSQDPMNTEMLVGGEWMGSQSHTASYDHNVHKADDNYVFVGSSIAFDPETRKIWVYNEAKDFRACFEKDISMELAEIRPDGD